MTQKLAPEQMLLTTDSQVFDLEVWGDGVGIYGGGEEISAPWRCLRCLGYVQECC